MPRQDYHYIKKKRPKLLHLPLLLAFLIFIAVIHYFNIILIVILPTQVLTLLQPINPYIHTLNNQITPHGIPHITLQDIILLIIFYVIIYPILFFLLPKQTIEEIHYTHPHLYMKTTNTQQEPIIINGNLYEDITALSFTKKEILLNKTKFDERFGTKGATLEHEYMHITYQNQEHVILGNKPWFHSFMRYIYRMDLVKRAPLDFKPQRPSDEPKEILIYTLAPPPKPLHSPSSQTTIETPPTQETHETSPQETQDTPPKNQEQAPTTSTPNTPTENNSPNS